MIGQRKFKLCSITFRLMELNAFLASIKRAASVSSFANISHIVYMGVLAPTSWPALSCRDPAASVMSLLKLMIITFPAILLKTSPTPIGRNPDFSSKGINLQAVNSWRDVAVSCFSIQGLFITWANFLCKMFQIFSKLKFCPIHLHQDQIVLILFH